jgi:hypothetical protein
MIGIDRKEKEEQLKNKIVEKLIDLENEIHIYGEQDYWNDMCSQMEQRRCRIINLHLVAHESIILCSSHKRSVGTIIDRD